MKAGNGASAADEEVEQPEIDTTDIFGFTEGADTPDQGEKEVSLDGIGRFGKRRFGPAQFPTLAVPGEIAAVRPPGGSFFGAFNAKLGYQYGLTADLSIELGLFGDARRVKNVPDLPNKSFATFDGLSAEFKYRLVKRTKDNPFGLAVMLEPRWARVADVEGRGENAFSLETRLLADMRLIPDTLWFATNLGFEPEVARLSGSGQVERGSTLFWWNALSLRVAENTFIGAEIRYLRDYGGAFLNRFEGDALFLGPTLHHRFGKEAFVTLAYSGQVLGHDRSPDFRFRSLDLTHFERHQFRVKIGVEF